MNTVHLALTMLDKEQKIKNVALILLLRQNETNVLHSKHHIARILIKVTRNLVV